MIKQTRTPINVFYTLFNCHIIRTQTTYFFTQQKDCELLYPIYSKTGRMKFWLVCSLINNKVQYYNTTNSTTFQLLNKAFSYKFLCSHINTKNIQKKNMFIVVWSILCAMSKTIVQECQNQLQHYVNNLL